MAFKIVGRSRSKKEALELGEAYKSFIKSLSLIEITKDLLCNDLYSNWLSEEWINCFIDSGRMLSLNDIPDNIIEEISPQFVFEAAQGRLYALLHSVRPVEGGADTYFYVKKGNSEFRSPYTMRKINIDNKSFELLQQMIDKLVSKYPVMQQNDYYLHVHAACLFDDIENNKIMLNSIKHDLVQYFRNKEHAMPKEQKNLIIYSNSVDAAFEEILQTYMIQGNDFFFFYEHGVTEKDLFRPMKMPA
ncbi:21790_t:CDS:2 [Gigaspora margarita]|uniref:21790_t:CDS:1 n=1 Tax=Gigaspora margarita TaxID=4874 RepID=A0ABN7V8G1_GIGMA|nr:21790_t:CDS:2 [Gigaspora margarita]